MVAILYIKHLLRTLGFTAVCATSCSVFATPILRCQLEQGGQVQTMDVRPDANPYSFKAIDIRGHFRFRAVVIGSEQQISYVKLYTYYQKGRQSLLMHQVKYISPAVQSGNVRIPLTGVVQLFSPNLGREIQYSCDLVEANS